MSITFLSPDTLSWLCQRLRPGHLKKQSVMAVFGFTGAIGSGKSPLCNLLQAWGVAVVAADEVGRDVVPRWSKGLAKIMQRWTCRDRVWIHPIIREQQCLWRALQGEDIGKAYFCQGHVQVYDISRIFWRDDRCAMGAF